MINRFEMHRNVHKSLNLSPGAPFHTVLIAPNTILRHWHNTLVTFSIFTQDQNIYLHILGIWYILFFFFLDSSKTKLIYEIMIPHFLTFMCCVLIH